ncbi:hypothetical protein E8L99_17255 [Phreatobacter aquaticus]|uniref:Uncharacterized protein n=1 Tax=Phreatobacter aquaticus TaxID=2570229 RepID=A0A4D7QR46_9HYPH|nr:hypothetical protein [Phreatobacter aquaticus]QCK87377.1 hypothetical protein E8L99_17255 [Phreatobacter aquaticus]
MSALIGAPSGARANALEPFLARLGEAQVQYRTTTTLLRAGRNEDAEASLKKLTQLWAQISTLVRDKPPALFGQINLFPELIAGTGARLKRAADDLADGRADAALETILPLKRDWMNLRRAAGFYGIVECLDEASTVLGPLQAMRRTAPDLTRGEVRGDIIAKAAVYRYAVKRCESFANADLSSDSDYRRLTEAVFAALDVAATAIRLRDPALLERVLTDLKGYDTQLSQRFGG